MTEVKEAEWIYEPFEALYDGTCSRFSSIPNFVPIQSM